MAKIKRCEIVEQTENLLRKMLIDASLKLNNKEMFINLHSENWRKHLTKDREKPLDLPLYIHDLSPQFEGADMFMWGWALRDVMVLFNAGHIESVTYEQVLYRYDDYVNANNMEDDLEDWEIELGE